MRPAARVLPCLLALSLAACGSKEEPTVGALDPIQSGPGGAVSGGGAGTPDAGALPPPIVLPDAAPPPEVTTLSGSDAGLTVGDVEGCTGSSAKAPPATQPKVDIVWLVDGSLSMVDEQAKIGANLAKFADAITSAMIDVQIVMMTKAATLPILCPPVDDDPLINSPLHSDPRYHFVLANVDSHNPLDIAISEFPNYRQFLRPDAAMHLVVVTDDDAQYALDFSADGRATRFSADMMRTLGKKFTLHTISSPGPLPCSNPDCTFDPNLLICAFIELGCGAAAPGATYYKLASDTGGLTASICERDWSRVFEPLQQAVIASAPLPCEYAIPPAPHGEQLDPTRVNVGYKAANAAQEEILPRADSAASCGDASAWHYDNPGAPSKIMLCPGICARAGTAGGTLNIAFGCQTVVLK